MSDRYNLLQFFLVGFAALMADALKDLPKVPCPFCGSREGFIKWGTYTRGVTHMRCLCLACTGSPDPSCIEFLTLRIQRVRCRKCGHTHAVLPTGIVPYRRFDLAFILTVLSIWKMPGETAEKISDAYGITPNTLNTWNVKFQQDLGMTGVPYVPPQTFLYTGRMRITRAFQQNFLSENCRLLLETPHGIRTVKGYPAEYDHYVARHLTWP